MRTTKSLCPECLAVIDAQLIEENGKLMIRKRCAEHGEYEDVYWGDFEQYQKAMEYFMQGMRLENPRTKIVRGCPYDCGICPNHRSRTLLAIIDLTNRCNLNCPICFANANNPNSPVYEVTNQQAKNMIDNLVSNKPLPPSALQFSGGEPTLRDDLPELVQYAKQRGIDHVEVNTNGLRLVKDIPYFQRIVDAGMSTLYLSFEGVTAEPYLKTKGRDLHKLKFEVVETSRRIGLKSIMLVPTIARGVNDDQLGDIIRYAAKNNDVISGVNGQPISFAGRVSAEERRRLRITIPEVTKLIEEQTDGQIKQTDFYPVPFVAPITRAVAALKGKPYADFSNHPACGVGAFVFVEKDELVPINKRMNVEKFVHSLSKVSNYAGQGKRTRAKWELAKSLRYVDFGLLRGLISAMYKEGNYASIETIMGKIMMIGMMHFMDLYNFDLERAQMCNIHYALPDGRIIPFCTYNALHRPTVEAKFGVPRTQLPQLLRGISAPVQAAP
nr:radical SAM protein [Candidatus Njordarchaeum guaymaensis]